MDAARLGLEADETQVVPAPGQDVDAAVTEEAEAGHAPGDVIYAADAAVAEEETAAAAAGTPGAHATPAPTPGAIPLRLMVVGAIGGAAGSAVRAVLSKAIAASPLEGTSGGAAAVWPWHTFTVNVAGSAILGALTKAAAQHGWRREVLTLLGAGFCGGLTTFSTLCVEALGMFESGHGGVAVGYLFASQACALVAACAGWAAAKHARRPLAALGLVAKPRAA
jgi:CrcB protein